MGVRLKPCPFCGSIDIYETHSEEDTLGTKNPEIFCNSCKIIFSIEDDSPYTDYYEDYAYRKAKTMEAWNMRPLEEEPTGILAHDIRKVIAFIDPHMIIATTYDEQIERAKAVKDWLMGIVGERRE